MSEESHQEQARRLMQQALEDLDLPRVYFNGAGVSFSGQGDVTIVLTLHDRSIAVLVTTYTVAKTLSELLAGGVSSTEDTLRIKILTTREVEQRIAKGGQDGPDNDSQ